MKKYFIVRWQNKEKLFMKALSESGYISTQTITGILFGLFQIDAKSRQARRFHPFIEYLDTRQRAVFAYPHSARPPVIYDGIRDTYPKTRASFVSAAGHEEIMRLYGYPHDVVAVGFPFCEVMPFKKPKSVKSILFAPVHSDFTGTLNHIDFELNSRVYDALYSYCMDTGVKLKVRTVSPLEQINIENRPGVKFIWGEKNGDISDIHDADVVVAHQTYAYMAVACGKPTLMFGEDIPPRSGYSDTFKMVNNFDRYAHLLAYPIDVLRLGVGEAIEKALENPSDVKEWKKRIIGNNFDGELFVRELERRL